jgi:hypothetical protein
MEGIAMITTDIITCHNCGANYTVKTKCPRCGAPQCCTPADDFEAHLGREADLQAEVEDWLTECGYYWFHDRSRGKNKPGHPDLVVALPRSVTAWIELKTKTGSMSKEQKEVAMRLGALGHPVIIARSLDQVRSEVSSLISSR